MRAVEFGLLSVLAWASFAAFALAPDIRPSHSLTIARYLEVTPDIYRGGRPTASDLATIQAQNEIFSDIDLENDNSAIGLEKTATTQLKMQFLSTPMDPYATPTDAEVNGVLAELENAKNFPIFVHCHYGEDRTGLIIALYRVEVQNWTPTQARQEMLANGFHTTLTGLDNYFRQRTGYTGK